MSRAPHMCEYANACAPLICVAHTRARDRTAQWYYVNTRMTADMKHDRLLIYTHIGENEKNGPFLVFSFSSWNLVHT